MPKEIQLKLKRDATANTEQGQKHSFSFKKKDDDFDITMTFNFWGDVPNDWKAILAGDIDDKINVEVGGDTRQARFEE